MSDYISQTITVSSCQSDISNHLVTLGGGGGLRGFFWEGSNFEVLKSGFEITRMILTSCQTYSVQFKTAVLCSQSVLPCPKSNFGGAI